MTRNWLIITVLGILFITFGCVTRPTGGPEIIPGTAAESVLVKLVDTNWLVLIGAILCMTGVYTFINSGTKGLALIGAGLTGIGVAGAVAAYFALLADYGKWILLILGILLVAGIAVFIITAADINEDGKINWQDIKDLLRKR